MEALGAAFTAGRNLTSSGALPETPIEMQNCSTKIVFLSKSSDTFPAVSNPTPTTAATVESASRHSQQSFTGGEPRESRNRSFAMAPPTAPPRRGSLPASTSPGDALHEQDPYSHVKHAARAAMVELEDDTLKAQEWNEGPGKGCGVDEDIVEYAVESPSGSVEFVSSDDEVFSATSREQEEGTVNPVLYSFFGAPAEEDVKNTVALSPEDAYYEGQTHPRRRTASADSVAIVQRLSLSSGSANVADDASKCGFLKKKSPNRLAGWQTRWFVLKDNRFMYFRDAGDVVPAGRIDLNLVKIKVQCLWDPRNFKCGLVDSMGSIAQFPQAHGHKWMELLCCGGGKSRTYVASRELNEEVRCRLKPVGSVRAFELAGPYVELVDWIDKISRAAKNCRVNGRHVMSVSQQKGFWKVERIAPEKFLSIADTGDILLFRTKVMNAALQRALTRGTYDHVALLLRSFKNQIFMLESMGDTGVIVTPWNLFLKSEWFAAYRKIVLRRLRWNRTAEKLDRLLACIKRVIGRNYELSLAKLFSGNERREDGGFFCSELVAFALQAIGALPVSALPSRFWPESFAARSNLKLCNGYELEEELLVDFTLAKRPDKRRRLSTDCLPQSKGRVVRTTVTACKAKDEDSTGKKVPTVTGVGFGAAQEDFETGVGYDSVAVRTHSNGVTRKSV